MRHLPWLAVGIGLLSISCKSEETTSPQVVAPVPEAPAVVAVAAAEPPAPVAEDPPPEPVRISVGNFNTEWFFDEKDNRSAAANKKNADSPRHWEWKLAAVARVLAAEDLDLVALQSVGGERELRALVDRLRESGGPAYEYALVPGEDRITSQQVAILSKFPLSGARRFQVKVAKHVAADVQLPNANNVTVIAAHLRSGSYASQHEHRIQETVALANEAERLRKTHPVIVIGDLGSTTIPGDYEYMRSAPGVLASRDDADVTDDCVDSAEWYPARATTVKGEPRDRVIVCGLRADQFVVAGQESIVVGEVDPTKAAWSSVHVDERDISDHFLVRGSIELPAPVTASADRTSDSPGQLADATH